jgi:hypothetical protein
MNRIDKKFRNDKMTPPAFSFFKGNESNPSNGPEKMKTMFRPPSYDFIVEWQMNEKLADKHQFT